MVKSKEIDIPNSCWNSKSSNKNENESTAADALNDFDKFMEELRQQKNGSTAASENDQGFGLNHEAAKVNDPWNKDVRSIWDSTPSESKCIPTYDFRSIWDTPYDTPIKSNADACQDINSSSLLKAVKPLEPFCKDPVLVSKTSNSAISKPLPQDVFKQQKMPALINGSMQPLSPTHSLKTIPPTQQPLTIPRPLTANTILAANAPIVYQQAFQPAYKLVAYPAVYVPCTTLVTGYPYQQAACVAPQRIPAGHTGKYKTELCRQFTIYGNCKYGEKCQFAHGDLELREVKKHPKYKTELCKTFHLTGFCNYGKRCHFIHKASSLTDEELQSLEFSDDYSSSEISSPVSSCDSEKNAEGSDQSLPRSIPVNFSSMSLGSAAQSPSSHFSSIATCSSLSKSDQKQQRTWADLFCASAKDENAFRDGASNVKEESLQNVEQPSEVDAKNE